MISVAEKQFDVGMLRGASYNFVPADIV